MSCLFLSKILIVNNLLKDPESRSPNRRWRDDELWKKAQSPIQAMAHQIQWNSHCQAISAFLTTASFCGNDNDNDDSDNDIIANGDGPGCLANDPKPGIC